MPESVYTIHPGYLEWIGYLLLWVAGLAASVSFVALAVSISSGLQKAWQRWLLIGIALLMPLSAAVVADLTGWTLSETTNQHWFFVYTLLWTLFFAGFCFMLLKRRGCFQASTSITSPHAPKRMAGLFVISLTIWFAGMAVMDNSAKATLASYQAHAASVEGLLRPGPVPDERNAYQVYLKADKILRAEKLPKWFGRINSSDFNPASKEVVSFLAGQARTLALTRSGVAMESFYFLDGPGFISAVGNVPWFRSLAILMLLDAKLKSVRGDCAGALADIAAVHRMAEQLGSSNLLLPSVLAVSMHRDAANAMEQLLANGYPLPKSAGKDLFPVPYAEHLYHQYTLSMLREGALQQEGFAHGMVMDPLQGEGTLFGPLTPIYRVYFAADDMAFMDIHWHEQQKLYEKPVFEAVAGLDAFAKKTEERGFYTPFIALEVANYLLHTATTMAKLRVEQAGVAAALFKQQNGRYPATLNELVPDYLDALPVDPFEGKLMRMKPFRQGLIIYSVGRDRRDDGGQRFDGKTKRGDIAFYLGDAYRAHRQPSTVQKH